MHIDKINRQTGTSMAPRRPTWVRFIFLQGWVYCAQRDLDGLNLSRSQLLRCAKNGTYPSEYKN